MEKKIKILVAEHDAHDQEMILAELKNGDIHFEIEMVQNESHYRKALKHFLPDVILCNYTFSSIHGTTAFIIKEELAPDTPFILISGHIEEENAIELIKKGVTDFVIKDRIFTLHSKIIRALNEAEERKQKYIKEKELVVSEYHLAEAQKVAKMGSWQFDVHTGKITWSKELYNIFSVDNNKFNSTYDSYLNLIDEEDRLLVKEITTNTQLTGAHFTVEYRITTSQGEKRIIREQGYGKKDEAGKIIAVFGTAQDITERKNAENEIKMSEEKRKLIMNAALDAIICIDLNGYITFWNPQAELIFGWTEKEALGQLLANLIIPEQYRKRHNDGMAHYLKTGKGPVLNKLMELSAIRKNDEEFPIELTIKSIKLEGHEFFCAFIRDITVRKKTDAALHKAYVEKNMVLESIDDGFFALDTNSIVTYWNKRAEILLGTKKEELIGKNLHEVFTAWGSSIFYDNFVKALTERITLHFEAFSSISNKWFAVSAFGSDNGLSVYFKDVTEQKNAAEKIKESELRYRSLIEQATDSICILDTSGKFIEVNSSACSMFDYSREEMLQLYMTDVLFEEDLEKDPIKMEELKSGKTISNERRIKRKDGTAVEVELSGKMIEDGKIIVFGRDISERKVSERLIRESEVKYRSFFESSMDGTLLTVPNGEILSANPAACEIFKMTEDEICVAGLNGIVDLTDSRLSVLLEERQRTGKAKGELTFLRKDGSKFEAEISSTIFTDSFGRDRTSMSIRDISERKAAESKLKQTSKELQQTLSDLNKILDFSMDIICTVDNAGKFVQVNAASQAIWGYSPEELINIHYTNFLHAEDVELNTLKNIAIKHGEPATMFENRFIHKNGSIVPMLWSANWDEQDQLMYYVGKDATEKKRLEKTNEIERQRFYGLYLNAPSCMGILKGPNHVYEMANPLYLELIGKSDIIGKSVKEVLPELESQGIYEILDTVYSTGNTFSANEMLVKFDLKGDGVLVDTYLNFICQAHRNHDDEIDGILFFMIDVTEQVMSRRKIEESEKRYRQIVETAQEGIWLIGEDNKTTFVNSKMCEILEYTEAEMIGKDIYFFMDEEGKQIAANLMQMKREGHAGQDYFKYISKSGKEVWTNLSANPLFDENGIYKGSLAMVTDITEKKRADQEMSWLINNTQESFILLDTSLNIVSFNNQFEQLYSKYLKSTVVKGNSILDYVQPERRTMVQEIYSRVLKGFEEEAEINIPLPDGSVKTFALKYKPAKDEHEKTIGVFVSAIDITEKKKSEQQLIIQEKRYRALVENGEDGVIILSPEGNLVYTSPTTEKILGYAEEELWKMNLFKFFHSNDLAEAMKVWEQVMNNPGVSLPDNTIRILHKDGSWRWLESTLTNMLHDHALKGIVVNFRDVTEKIQGEQLREFERIDKEALINTTNDFIWSVSSEFKLIAANEAFTKFMKDFYSYTLLPGDELLKKGMFSDEYLTLWQELYNRVLSGESIVKEMHRPSNGKHFEKWFETTLNPIYSNQKVTGIACYSRDTTERKQAEIHLKALNENLQKQAKELILSNADLEQFAYIASHDLQEPLRMITGFLAQLQKKYHQIIDDKGKQYIEFAVDGAKRMRQIILDLLEFSRVDRTEDMREDIDLNELVYEVEIIFRKKIQEKNATVVSDHLPVINGFKSPLRQVFQNLISNALKYTEKEQPPKIKITSKELQDFWQFAITDNGIGMEAEYFDKIFIIFQRLHNKNEYSGTGMGLAISKKIVETHGGRIWVESTLGKGSTFYFTLPKLNGEMSN